MVVIVVKMCSRCAYFLQSRKLRVKHYQLARPEDTQPTEVEMLYIYTEACRWRAKTTQARLLVHCS